jgi:hypothetical protein
MIQEQNKKNEEKEKKKKKVKWMFWASAALLLILFVVMLMQVIKRDKTNCLYNEVYHDKKCIQRVMLNNSTSSKSIIYHHDVRFGILFNLKSLAANLMEISVV